MNQDSKGNLKTFIFDCNIWIEVITDTESKLTDIVFNNNVNIVLTSYMIVEILRVLKRLSIRLKILFSETEMLFWSFSRHTNISFVFNAPISDSLINEVKNSSEIQIIAKVLKLEPKDVPYIIGAHQYNATIVTEDIRSLYAEKKQIQEKIGIKIIRKSDFINDFHK